MISRTITSMLGLAIAFQPIALQAATLDQERPGPGARTRSGTFAGARVRLALGGKEEKRKLRAGLALAPQISQRGSGGPVRYGYGEGMEFGFVGGDPAPRLMLAGYRLAPGRLNVADEDGKDDGPSTLGTIGIVVGGLLVVGGVGLLALDEALDCDAGSECN